MLLKKLSTLIMLIFLSLSIAPCSLGQYQHQKTLKLSVKFPSNSNKIKNFLTKPADAPESYIPSFVDRIEFAATGEECSLSETRNRDSDGNLSNEFEVETAFGSNCQISVTAYTCSCTIAGILNLPCDENCPSESLKWQATHEVSQDMGSLSSSTLSSEISLELTRNTGLIDEIPTTVRDAWSDGTYRHCLDVNTYADIGIVGPASPELPTMAQVAISNFRKISYTSSYHNLPTNIFTHRNIRSCKFDSGIFYIPMVVEAPLNQQHPGIAAFIRSEDYSTVHKNSLNDWSLSLSSIGEQPGIDINHGFASLFTLGSSTSGRAYLMDFSLILDDALSGSSLVPFFKYRDSLKVIINGEDRIAVFARNHNNQSKKIIESDYFTRSADGTWKYNPESELTEDNAEVDAENLAYYSVAVKDDGTFFFAYHTTPSMNLTGGFLDQNAQLFGPLSNLLKSNDLSAQRDPDVAFFDGAFHIVWADNKDEGNTNYKIYYATVTSSSSTPDEPEISEPQLVYSSDTENCYAPKIAINDDGFGVISWIVGDISKTIFYKRLLF